MTAIVNPQNANMAIRPSAVDVAQKVDAFEHQISVGAMIVNGSAIVTVDGPEIAAIAVGMTVKGDGIQAGTTVQSKSGKTITLTANATRTGGTNLVVGPTNYLLAMDIGGSQYTWNYGSDSSARNTAYSTITNGM